MWRRMRWVVIAIAVLSLGIALTVRQFWFPGQEFDPIAWADETQIGQGVRLGMADRLLARGTLNGKTRAEVVEMLGEPPTTEYFSDWDLVYWLGPERGFISIDSEWLVVRFGPDGRVTNNRLVRD
jgi:hypothetical protein